MPAQNRIKVFISATSVDLCEYVRAVRDLLQKSGFQVTTMQQFGAQPEDPVTVSLKEIDNTDYFIGIYARRYGYIPSGSDLSVTEQEYHHARKSCKPTFAFIVDDKDIFLKPGSGEDDGTDLALEKQHKLSLFLTSIQTALVRDSFTTADDLQAKVLSSLSRYEKRPKELQPQTNNLRLILTQTEGKPPIVKLSHNDREIGSDEIRFDPSFRHLLFDYNRRQSHQNRVDICKANCKAGVSKEFAAKKVGQALCSALLSGSNISEFICNQIDATSTRGVRLQVALQNQATEVERLPLETLYLSGEESPLALIPCVDLFRLIATGTEQFDSFKSIPGPLKILMAIAAPVAGEGSDLLDYEKELGKVMDIVERLPNFSSIARKPIVHILDYGTLEDICDAFSRNQYHILHISTHGEPGALILEKEDGTSRRVSARDFVHSFPFGRQPVLTLLSACHSGTACCDKIASQESGDMNAASDGDINSFAGYLVKHGFPYVVAMQDAVSDTYATQFSEEFYRHLTYDNPPVIEESFSRVRISLEERRKKENQNRPLESQAPPEWMVPALYKSNLGRHAAYEPDTILFCRDLETAVESFDPDISHRRIGEFVGRRKEIFILRQKMVARTGGAALITGMGGVGKSTLTARLLSDAIRAGQQFEIVSVVGVITLSEMLKKFGCPGDNLDQLQYNFFHSLLPQKGAATIFLLDNFEENLPSIQNGSQPDMAADNNLLELKDSSLAAFLTELVRSGKTRTIITSRYPFKLSKNQHKTFTTINLGPLSSAEIRKLMSRLKGFENLTSQERYQVARTIGGHPRTLEFLDAILQDGTFTYDDVNRRLYADLADRLGHDAEERLKKGEELSVSLKNAVILSARDCLLDQLLKLLGDDEKKLLFNFSVFQSPRPKGALTWLAQKENLTADPEQMIEQLTRLSLLYRGEGDFFVHRWTAEYLKEIMEDGAWQHANLLAGDYLLYETEELSPNCAMEVWNHYLEGCDIDRANKVAVAFISKLDTWGYWDLYKMLCKKMIQVVEQESSLQAVWLHHSGNIAYQQGDYTTAMKEYCKSLKISKKFGNLRAIAATYHQLGNLCHNKGTYAEAREHYRIALETREKLRDLKGMTETHHQLGNIYYLQGDYAGALKQYQNNLNIFEKLDDHRGIAATHIQLGMMLHDKWDYDGALFEYRKSLSIFEELGDVSGIAAIYYYLGMVYQDQVDYVSALYQYQRSLEIREKLEELGGIAAIYHQVGMIRENQRDYLGAREDYQNSMKINKFLCNWAGMAATYHHLGTICHRMSDYAGALQQYQKSLKIKKKLNDLLGMAISFAQMGILALDKDKDGKAFCLFLKAFFLFLRLQSPEAQLSIQYIIQVAGRNLQTWETWLLREVSNQKERNAIADLIRQVLSNSDD